MHAEDAKPTLTNEPASKKRCTGVRCSIEDKLANVDRAILAEAKLEKQRSDLRAAVDRSEMTPGELSRQLWKLESLDNTSRLGRLWSLSARLFTKLQRPAIQRPSVHDAAVSEYRAGIGALQRLSASSAPPL